MTTEQAFGVRLGAPITAADVLRIRAEVFPDMLVSAAEAEQLITLNDHAPGSCPEWRALFVEALTDYLVRQASPAGYVDETKARWLIERIARDGRIKTDTEFELLIRVLELAAEAPARLKDLVLEHASVFALSEGRSAGRGKAITADEADRLRRIIYATAGDGGGWTISRREAALLFAINDHSRGQDNADEWRALFVQGIGSALLAGSSYRQPSRDEALRAEAWLEAPAVGMGAFLGRMAASVGTGSGRSGGDPFKEVYAAQSDALDAAVAEASGLTQAELSWLVDQIGRDGVLDANEEALRRFVAEEASTVPAALEPLMAKIKLSAPRASVA